VRNDKFTGRTGWFAKPVSGSRQHYWHFLLGYLLPIVDSEPGRGKRFHVLSCGPAMDGHLVETLARLDLDYSLLDTPQGARRVYVEPWDKIADRRLMVRAAARVMAAWQEFTCSGSDCACSENLLLARSPPPAFYLDGSAQTPGYGSSRRAITNLSEISNYLSQRGVDHCLYEPGAHCLGCQIRAFGQAKRIFGIRGAEWANLIWTPAGNARVKVVDTRPRPPVLERFLFGAGIEHSFLLANETHVEIDPCEAYEFFTGS
jgi:hypothetical protein